MEGRMGWRMGWRMDKQRQHCILYTLFTVNTQHICLTYAYQLFMHSTSAHMFSQTRHSTVTDFVWLHVCLYTCLSVCVFLGGHVCLCACLYASLLVCMHACMCARCTALTVPWAASDSTVLPSGQISTEVIRPREPYLCVMRRSSSEGQGVNECARVCVRMCVRMQGI